ncbi:MAG: nucleotidyltransferase domain-containing protein [Candidatus Jordarchaeaceae archaeon]
MSISTIVKEVLTHREEVTVAYLFGSTVKGYASEKSDIDIGLVLKRKFEPDAFYSAKLAGEIEKRMGGNREIDLRILNNQSPRFVYQVIKEGRVIFCRDEEERVAFETSVTKEYLDFKPFYEEYDRVRRKRILTSS